MAIELNDFDDSFNTRIRDSLNTNTTTTNTANLAADLDNVGNTDASVTDSGNLGLSVDGSFNTDSHDTSTDLDVDIEDSWNDRSDNSVDDHSDNSTDDHSDSSTNDSYNDDSDSSINDSYNDNSDHSVDDHSVHVGNREFNLGGGMGGGAGDGVFIDQSVNANVGGDFWQYSSNDAVVASGDDSMAAGDDIRITTNLNSSTNISGGGDVNVGNTTEIVSVVGSYNEWNDSSTNTSTDIDVDIDDSWNDNSIDFQATDSFTYDETNSSTLDVDVDVNAIIGSLGAAIVDDTDISM